MSNISRTEVQRKLIIEFQKEDGPLLLGMLGKMLCSKSFHQIQKKMQIFLKTIVSQKLDQRTC